MRPSAPLARAVALAASLAVTLTGCSGLEEVECGGAGGVASIAWKPVADATGYQVYRTGTGFAVEPYASATAPPFVDAQVETGTTYGYLVVTEGGSDTRVAGCTVKPEPPVAPAAIRDLTCRAKNGRTDLAWSAVPGAASYRVLRGVPPSGKREIADVAGTAFADFGLVNGTTYRYAVVALDEQGLAGKYSNVVTCTPELRPGEGTPPPVVAAPTCRAKHDKIDVAWTPVAGATTYRVLRAEGGGEPAAVGSVTGGVFADFGLAPGQPYRYAVVAIAPDGAEAAPSQACEATPGGRSDGNRAPSFTSEPLTAAIERHDWYIALAATDPDGDAVTFSVVTAPGGMRIGNGGLLRWVPTAAQIGPQVVELRATDARGAYATQAFTVVVEDWNEPPQITSLPERSARIGEPYRYPVTAFDPEGGALRFAFDAPAPGGAAIDPETGVVTWTPGPGADGRRTIAVRATDAGGASDTQRYELDVFAGALAIESPEGRYELLVGGSLELPLRASQPLARFRVRNLPEAAGASLAPGAIHFAPTTPSAAGVYTLVVEARLGSLLDARAVQVRVVNPNRPPALAAPGPQSVDEGAELVVPLVASDPDGDPVTVSAEGALPANALFDALAGRLVFRPDFGQAGSYELRFAASDGRDTATASVSVTVQEREPPLDALELVVDPPASPSLRPTVTITGNVRGDPAQAPPSEPIVAITGLAPATARQGETLDVVLTGTGTEFAEGRSVASFGAGITVQALTVTSPTQATARIAVAPGAALGPRAVRVGGNGPDAGAVVGFAVAPGATVLTGRLVDSFTGQPLAGARVVVDGTAIEAETDADGRFRVEGVPPGAQRVLVARNDYRVTTLDLVFEANREVALEEELGMTALARPFQAGGSLPRAVSLPSILDRGLAGGTEALTQEQAEALVEDTLLLVGGRLVGVLDENGAQLNPEIDGAGMLSYSRAGIEAQARALLQGQRLTLREIAALLTTAFDWGAAPPDEGALVGMLQRYADAAWADPSDPRNAMAFVLLNEGTTLLPRPPAVSGATTLSRFQASLLVTAILLPSMQRLSAQADSELLVRAEPPAPALALPPPSLAARAGAGLVRLLDALVPAAHAQGTGEVILGPNTNVEADTFSGQTFTRMLHHAMRSFVADLIPGNLINAAVQTAIKATIALAVGSTGGVTGTTLAMGFVASLMEGAVMSVLEKLLLGYVTALAADALEPAPPLPQRSFIDEKNDKLVIEFARSASDVPEPGRLRQHSYDLFEFRTPNSIDVRDAVELDFATLSTSQRDPSKLQFAIPLGRIGGGVHYYRIATIQYLSVVAQPIEEVRKKYSYTMLPGAEPAPSWVADLAKPIADPTNYVKGQYHLSDVQKIAVRDAVRADLAEQERQAAAHLAGLPKQQEAELAVLAKSKADLDASIAAQQRSFDLTQSDGIKRAELLSRRADQLGRDPGFDIDAMRRSADPELVFRIGQVTDHYDVTAHGPQYRPEIGERMAEIAEARRGALEYERRAGVHDEGLTKLIDLKEDIASGAVDPVSHGRVVKTFDPVTGLPADLDLSLPADRNAALAHVDSLMELEAEKLELAQDTVRAYETDIDTAAQRFKRQELPDIDLHERSLAEKITAGEELERTTIETKARHDVELERARSFKPDEDGIQRQRAGQFKVMKPGLRRTLGVLNMVGGIAQVAGEINDIYQGTQLIYSDFSPPFRYTHEIRNVPRFSVEVDPNANDPDAIVIGRKGEGEESKAGWLRTTFFDTGENESEIGAGFPPEFVSVDEAGRIYAHNGNSATRFGGRIFRFDSAKGLAREFLGTVNYYSTLIQYGKPAAPIAMTVGPVYYDGAKVETLFVADIEQVGTAGVPLERPKPVLKQLPIALAEEGGPYHDPAVRSHFVAQPWVEDPRFRFTGPTDMVAWDDGSGTLRLYLSDEDAIYVVRQAPGAAPQVIELLRWAGAQWSGLAIDESPQPNFYFADHLSGFVYWVKAAELLAAEGGASLAATARPLAALQENGVGVQPYDIDVHQDQRKLVGTSRRGVFSLSLPVVLPVEPGGPVTLVKRLGREYRGTLLQGMNGLVYRVLPVGRIEQAVSTLRLVTRTGSADPVGATSREFLVTLPPAGPAEIEVLP